MKLLKHHFHLNKTRFVYQEAPDHTERAAAIVTEVKDHIDKDAEIEDSVIEAEALKCAQQLPADVDFTDLLTQFLANDEEAKITATEITTLCDDLKKHLESTSGEGGADKVVEPKAMTAEDLPEGERLITAEDITPYLEGLPEEYHKQVKQKLLATTIPKNLEGDDLSEALQKKVLEAAGELTFQEKEAPEGYRWLKLSEMSEWLTAINIKDQQVAFTMVSKDPIRQDLDEDKLKAELEKRQENAEIQLAGDNQSPKEQARANQAARDSNQDPETVRAAAAVAGLNANNSQAEYQAVADATNEYSSQPGTLFRLVENLMRKLGISTEQAKNSITAGVAPSGASSGGRYLDGSQFNGDIEALEGEGDHARLDHASAASMLSSKFSLKEGVSAQGMRAIAVRGMHALDNWLGTSANDATITSITDGTHAGGTYSHGEGYKVDLRSQIAGRANAYGEALAQKTGLTDPNVDKSMVINLDGTKATIYRHARGGNNHFDIAFVPA